MHLTLRKFHLLILSTFPLIGQAQELSIGNIAIDITKSGDIHSADIKGSVHFDADSKTLTLENAVIQNADIRNLQVDWLSIRIKGKNHIANKTGALFLLRPTKIIGDGTLTTSCDSEYSDLYNESSVLIEDCTIMVGAFRGVFSSFLEIRNASVSSQRGIFFHSGLALKNCAIVEPKGGVYDGVEHAISLNGWFYKRKVRIDRTIQMGIDHTEDIETPKRYYDIQGRLLFKPQRGIHLIQHPNGQVEKIIR